MSVSALVFLMLLALGVLIGVSPVPHEVTPVIKITSRLLLIWRVDMTSSNGRECVHGRGVGRIGGELYKIQTKYNKIIENRRLLIVLGSLAEQVNALLLHPGTLDTIRDATL